MNIPNSEFEVRQHPPTGIFILTFFGTFLLSAALCMPLALLSGNFGWVFFPLGPPILTFLVIRWVHAPCTVTADRNGLSVEVKRGSIGIVLGTRFWPWADLTSYDYFVNRGTFLTLNLNGSLLVFTRGNLIELRDLLRTYFPEKEKKRSR